MKYLVYLMLILACVVMPAKVPAQVDGSETGVSAERLLSDYLNATIYPPENRVLSADEPPLDQLPRIPGDAAHDGRILRFGRDQLQNGSLLVGFSVKINTPGDYSFRTYLYTRDNRPCLATMTTKKLAAGEHDLNFYFYGKALRDKCGSGNFRLPGILGEKLPEIRGSSGALSFFGQGFSTRAYQTQQFTDQQWNSAEKAAKIRELRKQAAQEKQRMRKR